VPGTDGLLRYARNGAGVPRLRGFTDADLEIHIFLHQQDNGHRGHNEDKLQQHVLSNRNFEWRAAYQVNRV
jgi:hypothetical protein